jgi:hypothetical protein
MVLFFMTCFNILAGSYQQPFQENGKQPGIFGDEAQDIELAEEKASDADFSSTSLKEHHAASCRDRLRQSCCCRTQRRRFVCACCSFLTFSLLIATIGCVIAFWPKDPDWNLSSLSFDAKEVQSFMKALKSVKGGSNSTLPTVNLLTGIELHNRNLLDSWSNGSYYQVSFKGKPIARGTSNPLAVPGNSDVLVLANTTLNVDDALAKELFQAIVAGNFHLTVDIDGTTQLKLPFGLMVTGFIQCAVDANVFKVLSSKAADVIDGKRCRYSYHF